MPTRAVLVYNPHAGSRDGSWDPEGLAATMRDWGWHVLPVPCGPETNEVLRAAVRDGADTVVSAGGDGTAHYVANAIAGSRARMVVLPCGTANDLAHSLGLPADPRKALEVARDQPPTRIDLGWVNGHYFLNVASIGVAADVAHGITWAQKERWGRWAYLMEAARRVIRRQVVPMRVCLPDHCLTVDAYQVSIANGCCFGGGFRVSPEASLDEGLLDVVIIEPGIWNLGKGATRPGQTLVGRLGSRSYRTTALTIETPGPVWANLDGEMVHLDPPLNFKVVPRSLEVYGGRP